jgi:hypothetical protein
MEVQSVYDSDDHVRNGNRGAQAQQIGEVQRRHAQFQKEAIVPNLDRLERDGIKKTVEFNPLHKRWALGG